MFNKIQKLKLYKFISTHIEPISLATGSLIVSIWTFVLFFVKSSTFDLVGQQLLSRQWTSGFRSGAVIGPTNYILKIIFLYIPLNHLPGSPRLKLILLTILINIVTYILLVIVIRKIYKIFFKDFTNKFYLASLWLATIAGSMYWINFSNSRNIEVVGGLFLVYLGIRLSKKSRVWSYISIASLSGIVFFADPLQLYMSAVPLIIYLVGKFLFSSRLKTEFITITKLVGSFVIGYVFAKFLSYLSSKIFGVKFIALTTHTNGYSRIQTVIHGFIPSFKHLAQLYTAGYQLGRGIEAINICFTVIIVLIGVYYAFKKLLPLRFSWFVAVFWATNIFFYIISGQSLQSGTARYLIMTIPIMILLTTAVVSIKHQLKPTIVWLVSLVVIINFAALVYSLKIDWNPSFNKDSHIASVISFMESSRYSFSYASMDSALPSDYFSNGKVNILPLSCNPGGKITTSYLFFDASYYKFIVDSSFINNSAVQFFPLILDGNQITNSPNICSQQDIVNQFGSYLSSTKLSDGSTVLIYQSNKLQSLI